jgi:signal transduction histidine kinase
VGRRGAARAAGDQELADDARLWRAVGVFRIAALLYAAVLHVRVDQDYRRPWGGWAGWGVLAVLGLWTAYLVVRRDRRPAAMAVDLGLACLAVLATRLLDDPDRIAGGAQTLPSIYPAAAVLAFAIWRGWRAGLGAALVVALADLIEVGGRLSAATVNNIVLLVLAGAIVGYAAELFRAGRRDLARAVAVEAATRERERLAADIHDSVLQVLAYVRKRGEQVGGEAAEIGRLAGEQEIRLRALVATGEVVSAAGGEQDVRAALGALATGRVSVTGPATPVTLPARVATAVSGAVRAALDNVERHAGPAAQAWVLVEDEDAAVTVTVRDDGIGIPPGRLADAEREGRLGVAASIRARIEDVGGRVSLLSAPGQGCEVEIRVPRQKEGRA